MQFRLRNSLPYCFATAIAVVTLLVSCDKTSQEEEACAAARN